MKKLSIIYLLLITAYSAAAQTNVLFGERKSVAEGTNVYMDREGSIYPEYFIADTSLQSSGASLHQWYRQHPTDMSKLLKQYHCINFVYSEAAFNELLDSIRRAKVKTIIALAPKSAITFLIHGFRKPFKAVNNDVPSPQDYEILKSSLLRGGSVSKSFVEVYWDGMYGCCFSASQKRNELLFQLFETAQVNAVKVGNQLRYVITDLKVDTLNIVTHSLGAQVACTALFDIRDNKAATPSQPRVNICLIAPAIAGVERFKGYYSRLSNVAYQQADNYRLLIVFNTKDFVLKKKDNKVGLFGPGPYKYGLTTLGCDYDHAATLLQRYFKTNYPGSMIRLADLSVVGKCHLLGCYAFGDNLKPVVDLMNGK